MSERFSDAPMAVWSAAPADAGPLCQVLSEGYALDQLTALPDRPPEQSPEQSPKQSSGRTSGHTPALLLLHHAPTRVLCQALAAGTAPEAALQAWQDQARAILALNRRDRRGVRVLDMAEAYAYPDAFRRYFGLPEGTGPAALLHNQHDDVVLQVLAQHLLQSTARSRALLAELEAVSINLSGTAPRSGIDADAVLRSYQAHRTAEQELETQQRRAADLQAEKARIEARSGDQAQQAKAALAALEARNADLQSQLEVMAGTQADLETQRAQEAEAHQQALSALEARAQEAQDRLAQLSERAADFEKRAVAAEQQQGELGDRVQLLEAQTKGAQEEMEALARRKQALEETLKEQAEEAPKLRKRLAARDQSLQATDALLRQIRAEQTLARDELDKERADREAARADADRLGAELDRVYGSRSFRLTGPLRRLRSALSGRDTS